jgi:thiol:disulfide interchange protein DsbD
MKESLNIITMTIELKKLLRVTMAFMLLISVTANAQFWGAKKAALLPETEAFGVTAFIDGDTLRIQWSIADEYYMYRDQFNVSSNTIGAEFGDIVFPDGVIEQDPEFGEVVVYFYNADLSAPIKSLPSSGTDLELEILGQGCNKPVGVCYPPQTRTIKVAFTPPVEMLGTTAKRPAGTSDFAAVSRDDPSKSFWAYLSAAFFIGILLSFTPCVLPLIPILLAIIAGQNKPSRLSSGLLALCYVAGTIMVYAIAGWVLGASGSQLQAQFQNPYVIGFVCSLLVVLATSLFGAFKIQLPSSLQTKLNNASPNTRSLYVTSFILGAISSLVVGACVSPLLIVAVGAAISLGDPILGAAVMSSLALGMGTLLIALGFGAGWLLPKTGAWMNHVQVLLGFMVLAAALFIASFIDLVPVLYFWAALLFWIAFYVWKVSEGVGTVVVSTLMKALCAFSLLWGASAFFGALSGGKDISDPLAEVSLSNSTIVAADQQLAFKKITTVVQAKELLSRAKASKQAVLVDFYADWCLDCKRMQRTTFRQSSVHTALENWILIEADVTITNDDSEALKKYFDVFGPPATLFIKPDGKEHQKLRQYGYMNEDDFLAILNRAKL